MTRSAHFCIKKLPLLLLLALCLSALAGCGKKESREEKEYLAELSVFFEELTHYDAKLSEIDPAEENAEEELLKTIDDMSAASARIAELEAPSSYEEVSSCAVRLSLEMQKAKDNYHRAFEGESFQEQSYNAGNEAYEKANEALSQMLTLLNPEAE